MKNFIKKICTVDNEYMHNVYKICGVKIKIKNNNDKSDIKSYLDFLTRRDAISYNKVIERIKANGKCRVAFYVFEISKWKTDNLFKLMLADDRFEPFIVVGMTPMRTRMYSESEKIKRLNICKEYFENKGYRVEFAYDPVKNKHISLNNFNPDVVFFQQHLGNGKVNHVKEVLKYALTCYVPYNVPNYLNIKYDYDAFCSRLFRFYTLNESLKNDYSSLDDAIKNIYALGHTSLDYYYLNKQKEKKYVIYAPHFSIMHPAVKNKFYYSTFNYNCDVILGFAKQHPELNWVFKPHPNLKESLRKMNISQENIEYYYDEWRKIGIICEDSDYAEMFLNSKAMITDCGSFLTEYFSTKNPLIHLVHPISINWPGRSMKPMFDSFYNVHDNSSLLNTIEEVILKGNDYKREERLKTLEEMGICNKCAAQNIMNDLMKVFEWN